MQLKEILIKEMEELLKLKEIENVKVEVEKPKDEKHGDLSTNTAMKLARILKKSPVMIANDFKEELEKKDIFEKVEVAGPGFINVYFKKIVIQNVIKDILAEKENYGKSNIGNRKKVLVEYVSANPTGYLHVGHARGAVVGDVVASVLSNAGYDVLKEYYINDAGSQMDKFSLSTYSRYIELLGGSIKFPEDGYHGEYIKDVAKLVKDKYSDELNKPFEEVKAIFTEFVLAWSLKEIRFDLGNFGIDFDNWFSEKSLFENEKVWETVKELEEKGNIVTEEGAKWFRTTEYGDDKDRVVVRADGTPTYYASDIAYHEDKIKRGYSKLIDVWGADHHGYVKRVKASLAALGYKEDDLDVILVQIVNLFKDGKPFVMSKRTGNFITLRELIEEVGKDVARMYFIMRSADSQFDFDLEAAKKQSSDNPAYYIQYAHARICSIIEKSEIKSEDISEFKLDLIKENEEFKIIKKLDSFTEVLEMISQTYEVHKLISYGQELASLFHSFYNKHKVLTDDKDLSLSRLKLLEATRIVLRNLLAIIGVDAPNRM